MKITTPMQLAAGGITAAQGFQAAGVEAGIRYQNRKDLALIYTEQPARAAAVFTRNRVQAAPLLITREHMQQQRLSAVVVNAGIANACTGRQGLIDARQMAAMAADRLGLGTQEVAVASTGVIGHYLPMDRLEAGIVRAVSSLSPTSGGSAAEAIMTTDTRTKEAAWSYQWEGCQITVGGMAKGSGMIHPNLATMLAFLSTDAEVEPNFLQQALAEAVEDSFNLVSVDGDTSTNDMVLLLANGRAGNSAITREHGGELFLTALRLVAVSLAKQIARDGEGATCLIEVQVSGAATEGDARLAARAVANSSLVKAAVYGRDANWGRVLAAVGYSGANFDPDQVTIWLGPIKVAEQGCGIPFDEAGAREYLTGDPVEIRIELNAGVQTATAWGCDLSPEYVAINASYRS